MKKYLLLLATLIVLSACDENTASQEEARQSFGGGGASYGKMASNVAAPAPATAPMMGEADSYAGTPPSDMVLDRATMGDRKIAETHNLSIETKFDDLQQRYKRDFAQCVKLGCQIINSSIASESGGQINARIAPAKLGEFLDFLAEGPGKIQSHQVSADDYTMEYSDVNATIENLMRLRERMASLLSQAKNVNEVLRIEQEISRIQTQLDQNTARIRILQKMTQMATVYINYSVEYSPTEIRPYELNNTWKHTVNKFMRAIDQMIQFIGGALPWIPVVIMGFWLFVRVIRFTFGKTSVKWPWRKRS